MFIINVFLLRNVPLLAIMIFRTKNNHDITILDTITIDTLMIFILTISKLIFKDIHSFVDIYVFPNRH